MPSTARSLPLVTQQAMTSPPSHFYSSLAGFPTPSYPDWMMFVNIFYTPPSLIDVLLRSNQSILKEISPGLFFGRNDAKAETPVLWPPQAKSWLIGKDSDATRNWGQEVKGMTEDEMAGWHHRLDGREFEWTPGDGDGQGGLVCCDSWGRKESDTTERLNWIELTDDRGCVSPLSWGLFGDNHRVDNKEAEEG